MSGAHRPQIAKLRHIAASVIELPQRRSKQHSSENEKTKATIACIQLNLGFKITITGNFVQGLPMSKIEDISVPYLSLAASCRV